MKTAVITILVVTGAVLGWFYFGSGSVSLDGPAATPFADSEMSVDTPVPGDTVSSPLSVTGEARGYWFFEADFPVELKDAGGTTIGTGIATAQSSWMTTDFVPFIATIVFSPQPAGSAGTLILRKDNPSGLPANDDSRSIPVVF